MLLVSDVILVLVEDDVAVETLAHRWRQSEIGGRRRRK